MRDLNAFILWLSRFSWSKPFLNVLRVVSGHTTLGDFLVGLRQFQKQHRRLPSDPNLFNDRLFQIRFSDEILRPERTFTTDKEFVKLYVESVVGGAYNVPTLAVIRRAEDVDDFEFPRRCVIKPTHASGEVIIRKDGEEIDLHRIRGWFDLDYYARNRERNYKYLTPKVIVESIIFDSENVEDIKFFCHQGIVKVIECDFDRYSDHRRSLFTPEWQELQFELQYPRPDFLRKRPRNLDKMIDVAEKLASPFDFVRIDLYSNDETLLVGEVTHCHQGALGAFEPRNAEFEFSRLIFGDVTSAARAPGKNVIGLRP
ncbi:ATP-grasp fold amidoligase family protein [Rhizobium sp. PAMB 3182]